MTAINRGPYTGEWYDKRNERRKERYHKDPKYRAEANKAARDGYRKARTSTDAREPFDPRRNLSMLDPASPNCVGKLRTLKDKPEVGAVLTFSKSELAEVFDRPAKQIQTWALDGRIPSPIIRARCEAAGERVWLEVYSVAEARALVNALGPHLAELIYFRMDNTAAIDDARNAVTKARKRTVAK